MRVGGYRVRGVVVAPFGRKLDCHARHTWVSWKTLTVRKNGVREASSRLPCAAKTHINHKTHYHKPPISPAVV